MDKKDGRPPDEASSSSHNERPPSFSHDPPAIPDTRPPLLRGSGTPRPLPGREGARSANRARVEAYVVGERARLLTDCRLLVNKTRLAQFGESAEELVNIVSQQVSANALASAANYDPARGSVRLWVYGIANHVVQGMFAANVEQSTRESSLDMPRRSSADPYAQGESRLERLASLGAAASSERAAALEETAFFRLISRIANPDYREVLDLAFRRGYSDREIAGEQGISYATARKRLERAKKLYAALPEEATDE